jgi:hypothetical protein
MRRCLLQGKMRCRSSSISSSSGRRKILCLFRTSRRGIVACCGSRHRSSACCCGACDRSCRSALFLQGIHPSWMVVGVQNRRSSLHRPLL